MVDPVTKNAYETKMINLLICFMIHFINLFLFRSTKSIMRPMPASLKEFRNEALGLVSLGKEKFNNTPRGKLIKVNIKNVSGIMTEPW